ncbi:unnamed protein product, partial [Symbiodinium sp. CCMP2592]
VKVEQQDDVVVVLEDKEDSKARRKEKQRIYEKNRKNTGRSRKSAKQCLDLEDKLWIVTAARDEALKQLEAAREALRATQARLQQVESYVPETPPKRRRRSAD